jgi:hypothetical protein
MEPTEPKPVGDVDVKREKERARKARYRGKLEARDPTKKAHLAPTDIRDRLGDLKAMVDPLSPNEAKRQLYHGFTGLSKVVGSDVELHPDDPDIETAGESLADLSKVVWPVRLLIKAIVPLVLVGALWGVSARIIRGTPWWQRRQEKKRDKEEREAGGLRVVQAPDGQPPAGYLNTPRPGIKLPRKSPV